jgi:hypothetical protein
VHSVKVVIRLARSIGRVVGVEAVGWFRRGFVRKWAFQPCGGIA